MDEDVIDRRVADACEAPGHRRVVVRYSVYDHGDEYADDDNPLMPLDEIAAPGPVVPIDHARGVFGGPDSRDYKSARLD
jgi:hypothetical protein